MLRKAGTRRLQVIVLVPARKIGVTEDRCAV